MECFSELRNGWKNTVGCWLRCSPRALVMNSSPSEYVLNELAHSQHAAPLSMGKNGIDWHPSVIEVIHCHLNSSASGYQQWHLCGSYGIQRNVSGVIREEGKLTMSSWGSAVLIVQVHLLCQRSEMLKIKSAVSKWGLWIYNMGTSLYRWSCEFELCPNHYNFINLNLKLIM